MAEKILVIGATGFIAGHCILELLASGYGVKALALFDKAVADNVSELGQDEAVQHRTGKGSRLAGTITGRGGCGRRPQPHTARHRMTPRTALHVGLRRALPKSQRQWFTSQATSLPNEPS